MTSNSGRARSKSGSAPPAMIVSVPSSARGEEPVTGASTNPIPRSWRAAPIRRVSAGAIVDMSTQSAPSLAPATTPSSPSRTSSTCAPSTTIVITTSLRAPTSAGVAASAAPCSLANASARERVRLWTISSQPARARFAAMREPMIPSPMKPTRSTARHPRSEREADDRDGGEDRDREAPVERLARAAEQLRPDPGRGEIRGDERGGDEQPARRERACRGERDERDEVDPREEPDEARPHALDRRRARELEEDHGRSRQPGRAAEQAAQRAGRGGRRSVRPAVVAPAEAEDRDGDEDERADDPEQRRRVDHRQHVGADRHHRRRGDAERRGAATV